MIHDDTWWDMMIHGDTWWYMMIPRQERDVSGSLVLVETLSWQGMERCFFSKKIQAEPKGRARDSYVPGCLRICRGLEETNVYCISTGKAAEDKSTWQCDTICDLQSQMFPMDFLKQKLTSWNNIICRRCFPTRLRVAKPCLICDDLNQIRWDPLFATSATSRWRLFGPALWPFPPFPTSKCFNFSSKCFTEKSWNSVEISQICVSRGLQPLCSLHRLRFGGTNYTSNAVDRWYGGAHQGRNGNVQLHVWSCQIYPPRN